MNAPIPQPSFWKQIRPSFAVLCVVSTLIGGCATPASHEGMIPAKVDAVKKHKQTVSVTVTGGKETDSAGAPQISDAAFRNALVTSIKNSQVFSSVVEGKGGDFLLTVSLFGMQQPIFGLDFTVTLEAGWTLQRTSGGAPVWQESIKSTHTATVGDAFAAVTRLRLATEGAAKKNIVQGLAKLSQLNL
jgi:hypothetical protein